MKDIGAKNKREFEVRMARLAYEDVLAARKDYGSVGHDMALARYGYCLARALGVRIQDLRGE